MKILSIIFLILAGIYGFFMFFGFIPEAHRLYFGEIGTTIAFIEIGVILCGYIAYRLWKKGKHREVIAEAWFVAALLFFFLGWFMHPDKVYKRAIDRITYWRSCEDQSTVRRRVELFQTELSARELEYQAAKLRYTQGISPPLDNWLLWIGSGIFVVNGIITLLAKRKSDAEAYYNLGRDAIEALKQAIRINPDNAKARFTLAHVYLLLGDKGSALEEHEILKDLDEDLAGEIYRIIRRSTF